ncbi:Gfo/Idh/MocA family protein [Thalassospira tepidiphila]|uniref:Gfo/Idh/MocA family protein n=1 Tax=Thalassospira tepidiphila TaxID=393657 RepID=UPI003AA7BB08
MCKEIAILIGMGNIGSKYAFDPKALNCFDYISHAQVLRAHPSISCVAAIDPMLDTLAKDILHWNIPNGFKTLTDFNNALPHLHPTLAIIATPPTNRLNIIKQLPKSVRAIVLEKPLSSSFSESKEISRICSERNIIVEVNYWRRFDSEIVKLKRTLNDRLGRVQAGFAVYGNGLSNNGIHVIDSLRFLLGDVTNIININDSPGSFILQFKDGITVPIQQINFSAYREIWLDLWGEKGRIEFIQEGLYYRFSELKAHRAISGPVHELDQVQSICSVTGAKRALYSLYDHVLERIHHGAPARSDAKSALENERVANAVEEND